MVEGGQKGKVKLSRSFSHTKWTFLWIKV